MVIQTARLSLIPATLEIARAELADRDLFRDLLRASVPDNWPPETARDALPLFLAWMVATPDPIGWFSWYALVDEDSGGGRTLVAGGGFKGTPEDGTVEIGYSVLPQYQGLGYATEMVTGLVEWAFAREAVDRVTAETEMGNAASERVLSKASFERVGPSESGGSWFELRRPRG